MEEFKKAQVAMLPKNEKSDLGLTFVYGETILEQYSKCSLELQSRFSKFYNLYIISDDAIKDGDWTLCLDEIDSTVMNWNINQCIFKHVKGGNCTQCKKIIATTDTSLFIEVVNQCDGCKSKIPLDEYIHRNEKGVGIACSKDKYRDYLPQPSQQFIEKYIEEYNKGDVIKDVLVEYELRINHDGRINSNTKIWRELKVNPENNTITIKKLKDSWSRKEIIKLIDNYTICMDGTESYKLKWIEENL
jgi:hypothetical protein|nr:MAG TPA: hypothetical protein [Caudoviricetes sp.]